MALESVRWKSWRSHHQGQVVLLWRLPGPTFAQRFNDRDGPSDAGDETRRLQFGGVNLSHLRSAHWRRRWTRTNAVSQQRDSNRSIGPCDAETRGDASRPEHT